MNNWEVFQTDVLDLLRQYQGFFDFFERIGSLRDNSRPDAFARISRDDKKEVWVIDAKNKAEIDSEDLNRMDKYVEMAKNDPIDIGLELSELSEYKFRGIFVTNRGEIQLDNYEQLKFSQLHQFLQKELIYTDTEKVIRDIAKMAEREQLSHSEARLLFRSMKPFEKNIERAMEELERIERKYVGLKLKKPPLDSFDFQVPVDAVLVHEDRGKAFLFDIPYTSRGLENVEEKVEEVKSRMESGLDKELYYATIDTSGSEEGRFIYSLEELESEIQETAAIVSPEDVVDIFTPKIPVEKEYTDSGIVVRGKKGLDFVLRVETSNDRDYSVSARLPETSASRIKDNSINARKELGELEGRNFSHEFSVEEDLSISYDERTESWQSYRDTVRSIYGSALNPVLSKQVQRMV
ncbi:hypothetical protein [Candidatus Nanohalovita haloferacivicina]|uniref:hypothetical protein n=1 Tax=Candidatus Nanohalovita haloferacivicina TaxID=2978046 RepID=UPI00325FC25E|nr:hypothetical protein HBNXNv_0604 [Candidatus Nanohalobia archaeon BNXNv]